MRPIILYRDDVDWKHEKEAAQRHFPCINSRMQVKPDDLVIARFSALPFYQEQERDFNLIGARMINSYEQHRYIADLGTWYWDLQEFTPRTWRELHTIPDQGPFILKGETNSKKFLWNTHMFARNKQEAIEVHTRLLEDSMLQYQNIYIREYIPLEKLMDGLRGLPITREYRFFVYKNLVLTGGFYWSSHVEELHEAGIKTDPKEVPEPFILGIISKIRNTEFCEPPDFYVIDVAKTESGRWILIELNDGQQSGLSENDPDIMYKNLKETIISQNADTHS